MVTAAIAALLILSSLVGFLTGRLAASAFPLVGVPLIYLGLGQGWWGEGLGDGWQIPAAAITLVAVAATALAARVTPFRPRAPR